MQRRVGHEGVSRDSVQRVDAHQMPDDLVAKRNAPGGDALRGDALRGDASEGDPPGVQAPEDPLREDHPGDAPVDETDASGVPAPSVQPRSADHDAVALQPTTSLTAPDGLGADHRPRFAPAISPAPETSRERVRTYLIAASPLHRQALTDLLEWRLNLSVACTSGFEPANIFTSLRAAPRLVIADIPQPLLEVIDAVRMVPRLQPTARLIVLIAEACEAHVAPWRTAGVDGLLTTQAEPDELDRAVREIVAGKRYIAESVMKCFGARDRTAQVVKLSKREAELLPLIASGLSLRKAAEQMTVAYKTADSYRTSLLRKLGLRDRVELTRYAIRNRIITP